MSKQRNMSIDIIKCLAIFSVIGVHFILNTSSSIVINSNLDIAIYLAYRQIFIVCVPLFLLTTGYLNIRKEPTREYYKKFFSILSIYFFYSIISLLFRIAYMQDSVSFINGIKLIFTFQAIPYAWYVNMFLGLYLLIPFINKVIKNSSKKEVKLFIVVVILISVLPATWNNFTTFLGYTNIIPLPNFWSGMYPIAYYIIGGYIKIYPFSMGKNYYHLYLGSFIYVLSIGINYVYSDIGNISNIIKDYSSMFILIQSVSLFIFLLNKKYKRCFFKATVIKISKYTLEIYLISYVVDNFIYHYFKSYIFSNTIKDYFFALPIIICVFLISFLLVFCLKWLKEKCRTKFKSKRNKYLIKKNKETIVNM